MGNESYVNQRDFYVFIDRKNRLVEAEGVPVQVVGMTPEDLITKLRESIGGVEGLVSNIETKSGDTVTFGYSLPKNPIFPKVLLCNTDFHPNNAYPEGASHVSLSFCSTLHSDLIGRLETIAKEKGLREYPKI